VTTFLHGVAERYEVVIDYTSRAAMASTTTCRPAAGRERGSLDVEPVEAVGLCVSLVATRKAMTAAALFAPPPVTCPETSRGPHPESDLSDDGSDRDWPERA